MVRVFVSHSAEDRTFVEGKIISLLENAGVHTWYSRDVIAGAQEWQASIRDGLKECNWFMVVLSPKSIRSKWVRAEVTLAFRQFPEGRILPVLIDDCDSAECHIQLPLIQHFDLRQEATSQQGRLLGLLRKTEMGETCHVSEDDHDALMNARLNAAYGDLIKRSIRYVNEHLVLCRDVGEISPGRYYAVRDFVDGTTLQDAVVAQTKFSWPQLLRIARHVVCGLKPVHEGGAPHGSVKPSNVFWCSEERFVLGDASLPVSHVDPNLDRLIYDYRYAAPESFKGNRQLVTQSDFYSLGCLLHQLAYGQTPYVADSPFEIAKLHLDGVFPEHPPDESEIPIAFYGFLKWLLTPIPERRPRGVTDVLGTLDDLERGAYESDLVPRDEIEQTLYRRSIDPEYSVLAVADPEGSCDTFTDEPRSVDKSHPSTLRVTSPNNDGTTGPPSEHGEYTQIQPKHIGRYSVQRRLGEGSFGCVYLAHDGDLERNVAIKIPHDHRVSRPEAVEAYIAEARVLAKLDHPAIVPVYDVGRTDYGSFYVVSKLIEGSNLATKIKENRPSYDEAVEITATVAEALHYAHTQKLVHRDIKPANILLDAEGRPYVADFGLALKDEDFGKGPGWAGTPAYMSPEQARGEGHLVDGRTDIFSLGAVLYELLTGRRAFRGDSAQEVLKKIILGGVRPPRELEKGVPKELERICLKALSKRSSDRYTTASDLAEDLRDFLNELGDVRTNIRTPWYRNLMRFWRKDTTD